MSPELERLLEAYHDKRTCAQGDKAVRNTAFDLLLAAALTRMPGASREELLSAVADRYVEFRRQRLKRERERLSRLR